MSGNSPFSMYFTQVRFDPERDLVLLLAGHRAGVTADALPLVDDEAVSHVSEWPRRSQTRSMTSVMIPASTPRSTVTGTPRLTRPPSGAPLSEPSTTVTAGQSGICPVRPCPGTRSPRRCPPSRARCRC